MLASICASFAAAYDACACGFPDLLLWRVEAAVCDEGVEGGSDVEEPEGTGGREGGASGEATRMVARCVEVKGPGDRLSDRQKATLSALMCAGADAAVLYVAAEAG